jgi:hypothetical protein
MTEYDIPPREHFQRQQFQNDSHQMDGEDQPQSVQCETQ